MFWKKRFAPKEYEDLVKRIASLEAEIPKIITLMNSLRGIVNRKLGSSYPEDQTDNLKSSDGLDVLREANKKDGRNN